MARKKFYIPSRTSCGIIHCCCVLACSDVFWTLSCSGAASPRHISRQVLKKLLQGCELITSLYDMLQGFINDLFTDTEPCSLLTSITICFAASLLKLDSGIFSFFQDV